MLKSGRIDMFLLEVSLNLIMVNHQSSPFPDPGVSLGNSLFFLLFALIILSNLNILLCLFHRGP